MYANYEMEAVNAVAERRLAGAKRLDRPASLRLGQFSKVLLVPHDDATQGVLALSQDRLLSKWEPSRQMSDFSIGRSEMGKADDIEFKDEMVSTSHLKVSRHPDDFYYVEDRGSRSGTFEEEIREVYGENSIADNGWVLTSLVEQPTIQIGNTLVRIEEAIGVTGVKTYLVAGKRRMEVQEGTPFTIGAGTDNNLVAAEKPSNPFDRVTVVCFDGRVFINSYERPITIRTGEAQTAFPGRPIRITEAVRTIEDLQRQLRQEEEGKRITDAQLAAQSQESAELQQRIRNLESQNLELARNRTEADTRIHQLEEEIRRLRSSSRTRSAGTFAQLDNILRGLAQNQQREILHALRRSFGKQLHPDTHPDADQEVLKRVNGILDGLSDDLK